MAIHTSVQGSILEVTVDRPEAGSVLDAAAEGPCACPERRLPRLKGR